MGLIKNVNQRRIDFSNCMGGECLVGPPESIPDNCVQLAYNFEYAGEILQPQVVPGVVKKYSGYYCEGDIFGNTDDIYGNESVIAYTPATDEIKRGVYDAIHDCMLIATTNTLWKVTNDFQRTLLGTLSGTYEPIFCPYDTYMLIASGGQIQKFDGTTLSTLENSPTAHHVSTCFGRVRAYSIDSDVIHYSAIGDPTGWTNNASDISSSQFIQIGYKDSGVITSTMMLSQDLIVLKSSGTPYRVIGEDNFANIRVVAAADKVYAWNYYCGLSVGNKCYFMGKEGFESFSTVTDYGAVKLDDPSPGYFVNARLALDSDSSARLWHVPTRKQIWVKARNDKFIYIYHYNLKANGIAGSWTRRTFNGQINDVFTRGKDVFIFYDGRLGILDETTSLDDGNQSTAQLISKRYRPNLKKYVINHLTYIADNLQPGDAVLDVSTKQYPYTFGNGSTPIYGNTTPIYGNVTPIVADEFKIIRKNLQKRVDYVEAKVTVNNGRLAVREMVIDVSEVNF